MIQKLSNIADQLREREQILPEVQLVSKALATLPENFRIVRTVWTSLPANDRTLDHLLQRLITEESVLKSYQTKTEHNNEAAFTANNSRQRFNSGRGGSGRERHGVQGGFARQHPWFLSGIKTVPSVPYKQSGKKTVFICLIETLKN
ncbi:hypothetical protein DAPPUDRAFT_248687 [Daphnia pulex]|uniref:Uncharacterized protein n=1 Tax=Daphnia pulex TaxID=6669 RepID=E9GV10_DAPPU|nr:hypothetical protein DAPPUDRAFT_248687 [Daphnia pulex]|eukprot:EFX76585.1 hypothetical protein DAPPUDRAFT_248687 [Daphnia pulex]